MPKFTTKPVEVEARQYEGRRDVELIMWLGADRCHFSVDYASAAYSYPRNEYGVMYVGNGRGAAKGAKFGDWFVKDAHGNVRVYDADVFDLTFDAVDEAPYGRDMGGAPLGKPRPYCNKCGNTDFATICNYCSAE